VQLAGGSKRQFEGSAKSLKVSLPNEARSIGASRPGGGGSQDRGQDYFAESSGKPAKLQLWPYWSLTDRPARRPNEELPMSELLPALLPALELETAANPRFAVIWLHGLGADGSDFEPVVPELGLTRGAAVRFVFPHAPEMPVTCNGGYVMPAWYDIVSLEPHSRKVDEAGIVASRSAIRQLIARENRRGIPSQRIFLAGFSQGGAVAYTTALTHPEPLAGLIALSTYLPVEGLVTTEATAANQSLPIFAAHGSQDGVVAPQLGRRARDFLQEKNYAVDWHDYPMPHSVCIEEVRAIGQWLNRQISRAAPQAL
jgi:phospholipase/carboxylesterase